MYVLGGNIFLYSTVAMYISIYAQEQAGRFPFNHVLAILPWATPECFKWDWLGHKGQACHLLRTVGRPSTVADSDRNRVQQ